MHDLPLDVIVVDTDWHKYMWHGFDWNKRLFPEPKRFKQWLKNKGLHATFNVHPQYIPRKDSRLPEFFTRTGVEEYYLDEAEAPHPFHAECYPADLYDKKQAMAYFDIFHKPIEEKGCGMWWIDGTLVDDKGRETNTWLNEAYAMMTNNAKGHGVDVVFSRAYGLGAHRSTIVFTGDTFAHWEVLEQEVVTTQKAANCMFAYVSHDIGAFLSGSLEWKQNKLPDDLFIRWTQFGCLSPIMRFHSDHGIREPWRYKKETLRIIKNFLHFRECLKPYLLLLANEAHDTGVALCRPMYYEFPELDEAYKYEMQYMLGNAMLVSPVTNADNISSTWIPPGTWHHCFNNQCITGPAVVKETYPLTIMPLYIREGSSIPYRTYKPKAKRKTRTRIYSPVPGKEPLSVAMKL